MSIFGVLLCCLAANICSALPLSYVAERSNIKDVKYGCLAVTNDESVKIEGVSPIIFWDTGAAKSWIRVCPDKWPSGQRSELLEGFSRQMMYGAGGREEFDGWLARTPGTECLKSGRRELINQFHQNVADTHHRISGSVAGGLDFPTRHTGSSTFKPFWRGRKEMACGRILTKPAPKHGLVVDRRVAFLLGGIGYPKDNSEAVCKIDKFLREELGFAPENIHMMLTEASDSGCTPEQNERKGGVADLERLKNAMVQLPQGEGGHEVFVYLTAHGAPPEGVKERESWAFFAKSTDKDPDFSLSTLLSWKKEAERSGVIWKRTFMFGMLCHGFGNDQAVVGGKLLKHELANNNMFVMTNTDPASTGATEDGPLVLDAFLTSLNDEKTRIAMGMSAIPALKYSFKHLNCWEVFERFKNVLKKKDPKWVPTGSILQNEAERTCWRKVVRIWESKTDEMFFPKTGQTAGCFAAPVPSLPSDPVNKPHKKAVHGTGLAIGPAQELTVNVGEIPLAGIDFIMAAKWNQGVEQQPWNLLAGLALGRGDLKDDMRGKLFIEKIPKTGGKYVYCFDVPNNKMEFAPCEQQGKLAPQVWNELPVKVKSIQTMRGEHKRTLSMDTDLLFDTGANVWAFPGRVSPVLPSPKTSCDVQTMTTKICDSHGSNCANLVLTREQLTDRREECHFGKVVTDACTALFFKQLNKDLNGEQPSEVEPAQSIMGTNIMKHFALQVTYKGDASVEVESIALFPRVEGVIVPLVANCPPECVEACRGGIMAWRSNQECKDNWSCSSKKCGPKVNLR